MLSGRLVGRGFTLIEVLIGLALFALLILFALPNFTTMLQNLKLRSAAEAILGGLQTARTEALRRNQTVQFALTDNQGGWVVRVDGTDIETKVAADGSNSATGSSVIVAGPGTVDFTGLGTVTTGATAFEVSNPTAGECTAFGGSMRCLSVVVSASGAVRMCDRAVPAVAGDTRAC